MYVIEAKLYGRIEQYRIIEEMIRAAQFIRNKMLRYWMDGRGIGKKDLMQYNTQLRHKFEWCASLNSMACQASVERAWFAISRFYANCKNPALKKKGYPNFKKNTRSVEYKTSGWKLSEDRRRITFTDKFGAGTFRMRGGFDLNFYRVEQIKRVRIIRRADGYYVQFCIKHERTEPPQLTGKRIGLDVGLAHFYTDSNGEKIENPRHLRKSEKALRRAQRRVSRKKKGSKNRLKAIKRLGRKHLKVQRQRKDFAVKLARCVVTSNDVVVHEDLQVRNLVKNHSLAKSISDAGWRQFLDWLGYFGKVYGKTVIAVSPQYTSQECSQCGRIAKKSLSQRTHICECGCVLDRDENAAINILRKGLSTVGQTGIHAWGHDNHCQLGESLSDKLCD